MCSKLDVEPIVTFCSQMKDSEAGAQIVTLAP